MFKDLFGSKTRQIILKAFFTNSDKEYYTRELALNYKLSVGNTHRELKKLLFLGILKTHNIGNIKLFSLNKQNSIYKELKNIFYKTEGLVKFIQETLVNINGIKIAFIYGSFAKGDEREDSDIDLFLIGDNIDKDNLVIGIGDLEKKLFREINYTSYTEREYKKEKNKKDSFVSGVIKGKKIFIRGSEDEL
jgi:predicted nucleotidyltransferase